MTQKFNTNTILPFLFSTKTFFLKNANKGNLCTVRSFASRGFSFSSQLKKHPFHIVTNSPWPLFVGFSVLSLTVGFVAYMHSYLFGLLLFFFSFIFLIINLVNWWVDVIIEATFEGEHTSKVEVMHNTAFFLFILSELFFFIGFFWTFFHFGQQPNINLGVMWLPEVLRDLMVSHATAPAVLNLLLITSSITITFAHEFALRFNKKYTIIFLLMTILLGLSFTVFQYIEYISTPISFSQSTFGSLFYLLTGFHGSHVIIGSLFLLVCLLRFFSSHFSGEHLRGFLFSIFYWHFVDLIWLFVLFFMYISHEPSSKKNAEFMQYTIYRIFFETDTNGNLWVYYFASLFDLPEHAVLLRLNDNILLKIRDINGTWLHPVSEELRALVSKFSTSAVATTWPEITVLEAQLLSKADVIRNTK